MEDRKYPEEISAEDLAAFDLDWFKGEIVLIDNLATFRQVMPRLRKAGILGFDTETKPSFKKGRKNKVSLLQIATGDLACLFRVNKIGMPDELVSLLSDKNIIKAGVAIHDDIRFLAGVRNFIPGGFIDLQSLVKNYGIRCSGLKKLCAIILGFRISKRQQVTDWEAEELSEAQLLYAATDAWVCHEIYTSLNGR